MILVRTLSAALVLSLAAGAALAQPEAARAAAEAPLMGVALTGAVSDVTVYRGQALVTRRVDLPAGRGLREVVITGLPDGIVPGSMFAEGVGGVDVRSVSYRARPVAKDARQQVSELEEKIQGARDAVAGIEAERAVDESHRANLERLEQFVAPTAQAELKSGVLNAETLTRLISFAKEQRAELAERGAQREVRLREAHRNLSLLERELATLTAGASRTAREAVLFVDAPEGRGEVRVKYLVNNATWQPSYNLRADEARKTVRIEYQAQVRQMSGEDWSNVSMTLSTATPALVSAGPRLEPMKLSLAGGSGGDELVRLLQSQKYEDAAKAIGEKRREAGATRTQLAAAAPADRDDARAYQIADKSLNVVAAESQLLDLVTSERFERKDRRGDDALAAEPGVSVTYVLPSATTLPSRSDQQLILIAQGDAPAAFARVATPVLSEHVYVEAEVANALASGGQGLVLLAGPVSAYLGEQFVGRGVLPTVSAGEKFTAGFGIDATLRARRELVERAETIQGGNRVVDFTYRLTIENFSGSQAQVRLLDRMPVAQGGDIKITLAPLPESARLSTDAAYLKNERKQGILRWDLTAAAGTSGLTAQAVEYSFKLEHDKQMNLAGLGG